MALLLDAPVLTVPGAPAPRRRPRWRALLMVVLVLVLTVSIVWQSQGKAKALLPILAGIAISDLIAPAATVAVGGALTGLVAGQSGPVFGGLLKKGWNWVTGGGDDKQESVQAPRNMGDLIAASPEGFPTTGTMGWICSDFVTKVDFIDVAGKPDIMVSMTAIVGSVPNGKIEDCIPPKRTTLSSANAVARCRLNGQIFENLVTLSGNLDMGYTKNRINGIQNGMCWTGVQGSGTATAQLLAVRFFEKPAPTSWRFPQPSEWVNPTYQAEVLGGGTITGIKKCINDSNPADVITNTVSSQGVQALPVVTCPPGYHPDRVEYTYKNGWVDSPVRQLGGAQINRNVYPQCQEQPCELKVYVNNIPCSIGLPECWDWMHTYPPEQLKCEYGPYSVGLAECGALEYAYRSGAGVTVDPQDAESPWRLVPANPDGLPDPNLAPGRTPIPNPWPTPNPNPSTNPSTTPVGVPFPTMGNNPDPRPPGGAPIIDPESGQNCIAGAWSWNPVNWVYTPVKCALTWAFVPKEAAAQNLTTRVRTALDASGLGGWVAVVPTLVDFPAGGGCAGPTLTMPALLGGGTYQPINACGPPLSTAAEMSRALITVVLTILGAFSCVNSVSVALTGYKMLERETAKSQ